MSFLVEISKQKENIYIVRPEGRLDADSYITLKEQLDSILTPEVKVLIFDLEKLEYINSSGLNVIFQAKKALDSNNGLFLMTHLKPQIRKIFDILKALPNEALFENMKEVDDYLDAMQKDDEK